MSIGGGVHTGSHGQRELREARIYFYQGDVRSRLRRVLVPISVYRVPKYRGGNDVA